MKNTEQTSYDEIPYKSKPFPQTHPDHLATLGFLFGLSPTPITKCRVLELGCASGGNLIPMAYHLPNSEFIGIDFSRRQVEMGLKAILDLNLSNIRLEHSSIMDINKSWGSFDYIICHGVFSWVPGDVQDKILGISSLNLAPQGIAYISYNTYPGWHMREMIRHMMLYHANQFSGFKTRIEQARALIDFLARSVPIKNNDYGLLLQKELNLIKNVEDWYLFHDHLEEVNAPVYFYQFIDQADRHGLQYLGEADFSTMLTSGFTKEVAETLSRISTNIINTEQYMDFIRNRHFRQTLLCHKGIKLQRDLGPDNVKGLLIASNVTPEKEPVNLAPGIKQTFITTQEATVDTEFALTKVGLTVLKDHWPRAIDQETLFREIKKRLDDSLYHNETDLAQGREILLEDMLKCYTVDAIEFHTWQGDFITEICERPKVSKLAAYLASQEQPVVNQRHEIANLDPVAKQMVRILDGTKDRAAILKCLCKLVEDGELIVRQNDDILTNAKQTEDALREAIEIVLAKFAKAAMLI